MDRTIVYTNDNCIGCNKCINVCSAIGACISKEEDGRARIVVDGSKCVACGSCIDVCVHGAREYEDDTERFFEDLAKGEQISLLLAPAFKANYPEQYDSVLGGLKQLGVNRIISVSFGADITTWGYLNYINEHDFKGGISQPCPAVVGYIERYLPGLIPKLFPVQSPLMCAAIYARKKLGITDRFAFISPCIAKKIEIEDPHNAGLVQYNVTFDHLIRYVEEHGISGPSVRSEIEYGLGAFYPTPGGLAENVRWFLGDQVFIRQIEGERHLYEWLHQNESRIKNNGTPFLLIDALNCEKGCICGTAVNLEKSKTDDALYELLKIREESKKSTEGSAWSRPDPPEERLKNYNRQFEDLDLNDYLRGYTDRSAECRYSIPDEEQLDAIFLSMNKVTEESRNINCTCCGYESCRQMATAIHNGFNHRENCIYYEKTMVRELSVEKEVAEAATRAKSAFLASMSHEIRTPINAVLGMDEMILRETGEENIRQYAGHIKRSGNILLSIINDILDFSKIEAGKMELVSAEYEVAPMISDLMDMVRPRMKEKGLMFVTDVDGRIPKKLIGDNMRLKQCILNLLTNAVKYTESGEVCFSVLLESIREHDASIRICVRDTGIGIKAEDMERLFIAFERFDETRNRSVEGTGLGMNIVQRLLALMDSKLEVESEYGAGSSFSFVVTQKIGERTPIGDFKKAVESVLDEQEKYQKNYTAPEADILIVDDTDMNLVVAKELLKETLIRVDTAHSGRRALELMSDKVYDVLLFDHMMPEMDGIELLHRLKALSDNPNSKKPCITLTANAVAGARESYIEEGFDDHMTKPIDGKRLESLLLKYLPKDKVIPADDTRNAAGADAGTDGAAAEEAKWYEGINGIDGSAGIRNCGSESGYRDIAGIFCEAVPDKSREIEKYYNDGDWHMYAIEVHALKSTSRIIGAAEFGNMAESLEMAGKSEDEGFIRENHDIFLAEYLELGRRLKEALYPKQEDAGAEEGGSSGKQEADRTLIESALDMTRDAASAGDADGIKDVLEELSLFEIPEKYADTFKKIGEELEAGNIEGILKVLEEA